MTASTSRAPLTTADYPLSVNRPDLLRTPTGKALSELTMDAVVSGALTAADVRIAPGRTDRRKKTMTPTQPAGQSRKRTSLRTDILEDRPVNLDGFVEEWPEK